MDGRHLGRIQKNGWLADNTSWSSRANKMFRMRYSKNGKDKFLQKSRDFQKERDSDVIPLLPRRTRKAHHDEYSDDGEYDESDEIYESDYSDDVYDGQINNDNDGYHEYCGCHSHYPMNSRYIDEIEQLESDNDVSFPPSFSHPILPSQRFPHMQSVPKPSPSKISPSSTAKPTRTADRKRTIANKNRKKKAKNITTRTTPAAFRATPVKHSRR